MADIAIIGAGTAGLTAAIYACRAGMDTVVLEAYAYGGQIINTPEIVNYPGIRSISGYDFATGLYEQASALGAKFEFDRVKSISGSADTGFTVTGEYGTEVGARAVIIATGASHRTLGLPGEEQLTGRGLSYCATCDGGFFRGRQAAVIGGGNTALDDAAYLAGICSKVHLIHRRNSFRGDKAGVDRLASLSNVEFLLSRTVKSLVQEEGRLTGLVLQSTEGKPDMDLPVDALFVAIGQIPSTDIFRDIVALDSSGYVIAGEDCRTSAPGIFVAGDCRTKELRQLTTAASDGAVASTAACEFVRG